MANNFYFAWVLPNTAFNAGVHNVADEKILLLHCQHSEGDFAALSIDIKNPRIGLLAPTRKTWVWLSWFNGATIVPLFYGRLVGVPSDIQAEVITLEFSARPKDYTTTKAVLADTLKTAPYYDPIWIADTEVIDPDTVLEARAALWHINRVTHAVTVSDILIGEDGAEEFLNSEVPYDSVHIRVNQPPLRSVSVDGVVNWSQAAKGSITLQTGEAYPTYTGDGLISGWPKTGASIGGGWSVIFGDAQDVDKIGEVDTSKYNTMNAEFIDVPPTWLYITTLDIQQPLARFVEAALIPLWRVKVYLTIGYDVERQRTEHVRFTLNANVQPIVTLPGDDEILQINLSSRDVGQPLVIGDTDVPIGDVKRRSYFPTDRGLQSLEYLIALARANLLMRSRAVEIEFDCRFERAIALTCRKNAQLHDHRLPGGSAVGKIIKYEFSADGNAGTLIGKVTIGCAVGYGGAISPVVGTPLYVVIGYVDDYQQYAGAITVLPAGDVGYTIPIDAPNDDDLDFSAQFTSGDIVTFFELHNSYLVQRAQMINAAHGPDSAAINKSISDKLQAIPTQVEFHLKPVDGGPFETAYDITVSVLELPKMIDLEAPA